MENDERKVLNWSIEAFGKEKTLAMCMEECGELVQAISKYIRYYDKSDGKEQAKLLDNLAEEMADVQVCTLYLQVVCCIPSKIVDDYRKAKLLRTAYTAGKEQGSKEKEKENGQNAENH